MHLKNRSDVSQSAIKPNVKLVAAINLKDAVPSLLAALDAADKDGNRVYAEWLITKIYETMDFSVQLPD